jgi:nucleoside permease NupC
MITAWSQGYPWLGLTTGWMLAALILIVSIGLLVPTIFLPHERRFGTAMGQARAEGAVTPELRAAFADPVLAAAHVYEALAVAIIVALMVLKPF